MPSSRGRPVPASGGGVIELHYPFRTVGDIDKGRYYMFCVCFVYAFMTLLDRDKCNINSGDCDRIKQFHLMVLCVITIY